jgi:hypothetical protein
MRAIISSPTNSNRSHSTPNQSGSAAEAALPHLHRSEWIFSFALLIFIASLFLIAKRNSFHSLEQLPLIAPPADAILSIEVTGCVGKPGTYSVRPGTSVRTVLRKARLGPAADVTNISLDQGLDASGSLHVPVLEKIIVEVGGCVEQRIRLTLPAGSRICDLKSCVILSADADPRFFKRRRRLKNNEVVDVPRDVRFQSASN